MLAVEQDHLAVLHVDGCFSGFELVDGGAAGSPSVRIVSAVCGVGIDRVEGDGLVENHFVCCRDAAIVYASRQGLQRADY